MEFLAGNTLSEFDDYLSLVRRLGTGGLNRSENDLSSNLKNALATFGLHGVIDTGSGSNRLKRPDIALYVDRDEADVGSAAAVIIELKKPTEVAGFPSLRDALVDDILWHDKFVPYVAAHAERVLFFVLTTFEHFLIVPITEALRSAVQVKSAFPNATTRKSALAQSLSFELQSAKGGDEFARWCQGHLPPERLTPPILSSLSDLRFIESAESLEAFASGLADLVVGPEGRIGPSGALVAKIYVHGSRFEDLGAAVERALVIYTMASNGGMTLLMPPKCISRLTGKRNWMSLSVRACTR